MTGAEDPGAVKQAARKAAFAQRKAARAAGAEAAAAAAAERFLADIEIAPGEVVSGYRPIRTEIDPTPLMRALIERGADLAAPVIVATGEPLEFRRWRPDSVMETGAFGAEIPVDAALLEPTLLIAPLVAFDRFCWRLGYGGGFYDRTLLKLRALRPTRAVGFAFAAQEAEALPRDETDQRLDAVVTESAVFRPQ